MDKHLFDSEWKLMELIWTHGPISAKDVSLLAAEALNWNKNTTYTVLKKLVDKGVLRRDEPNFICTPLLQRKDAQKTETKLLIDKLYHGSKKAFFAAFLEDEQLSNEDLEQLRQLIERK